MKLALLNAWMPDPLRRFIVPISCGLFGVMITLILSHIPHSYPSLILIGFICFFTVAHIVWFQKAIQSLRHDLKTSAEGTTLSRTSAPPIVTGEDKQLHDSVVEATFFQHLRSLLDVSHPSHIQAQSIIDQKTQIIQIDGILPLLKENRLEILVQPIVNLPQKRLSFFDCIPCVTLENGLLINLNTYSGTSEDLLFNQAIEKMVLFQTLQFIRKHHITHPNHGFACKLSPTLYQDVHALEEFIEFLHKSHFPLQGLILEIPLDIADSHIKSLLPLKSLGVRLMGKWAKADLPENLSDIPCPAVDFIMMPYSNLAIWLKKQPRRQGFTSLSQLLKITPQTIISHVEKEQDLYQHMPVPFDFAAGNAFGVVKPFYHIQT